ncbi:MAG: hypothetical protein J5746_05150, partial [Victivallales bacterium]|nr:hypothetical protein [Victivallales bacterium]
MKGLLLFLIGIVALASAEIVRNPDENTLWMETGRNMQFDNSNNYSGKWFSSRLKFTEAEDGFIVEPQQGKSNSDGIAVQFSDEYPYLEYELEVLEAKPNAYMLFPWFVNLGPSYQQHKGIRSGYYVVNVLENFKYKGKGSAFMNIRVTDAKVKIKNLRMVKTPKYRFDVIYRRHEYGRALPMPAVLEISLSSKAEKLPDKLWVNYIDAVENGALELNDSRRLFMQRQGNEKPELYANPEIVSLGERDMNGGTVMLLAEGLSQPVITWLPYAWKQPAMKASVPALPSGYDWI